MDKDALAALGAYEQSCNQGDPGANGCWKAGQTAEAMGDILLAIELYQASYYPAARDRAHALQEGQQKE